MIYLLDANTCIRYINGRAPKIRVKMPTVPRRDVGTGIITVAELFYCSAKSQTPARSRQKQLEFLKTIQIVPFDDAAASIYGDIRAHLEKQGRPISGNDMLIAAIALANNLILV